jgi:hypothetical protein
MHKATRQRVKVRVEAVGVNTPSRAVIKTAWKFPSVSPYTP